MKNLLIIVVLGLLFTSCSNKTIEEGTFGIHKIENGYEILVSGDSYYSNGEVLIYPENYTQTINCLTKDSVNIIYTFDVYNKITHRFKGVNFLTDVGIKSKENLKKRISNIIIPMLSHINSSDLEGNSAIISDILYESLLYRKVKDEYQELFYKTFKDSLNVCELGFDTYSESVTQYFDLLSIKSKNYHTQH